MQRIAKRAQQKIHPNTAKRVHCVLQIYDSIGCYSFKDEADCGSFIEPLFMELAIPLSKNGEPLFRQVYLGLRQAILSATFSAGGRLPSTRDLAEQLGISRTVVVLAYDQLLAEGRTTTV